MAKKVTKEQSQYFAARVRDIFNSKCKQIIESYAGMYWPNNGYGQPQAQWANRDTFEPRPNEIDRQKLINAMFKNGKFEPIYSHEIRKVLTDRGLKRHDAHEAKRKQLLAKCQAELDALNAKSVEILDQFNLGSNEAAMELLAKLES